MKRSDKSPQADKLSIIILGPSNVGKTTVVASLCGEPTDDILPTVGFSPEMLTLEDGRRLSVYDVGGGKRIRGIWDTYLPEVSARSQHLCVIQTPYFQGIS